MRGGLGGVLVDEYLETNIKDVFAIGDCAEHQNPPAGRRAIEQIWYTGRIMGETVARTICGKPTKYNPSVFFNSANFFDIEYQTYGQVSAQTPEGIKSFVWQHPTKNILIRINYRADNQRVMGINAFGIRMRHEVWDKWLNEGKTIDFVLENLNNSIFDAELSTSFKKIILVAFEDQSL